MNIKLQLVAYLSDDRESMTEEVFTFKRDELTLENLGLTLAESKDLLKTIQQKLIDKQIAGHAQAHTPIGLRKKGTYPIRLKTLFGDVIVESPRYYHPQQEAGAKTFSPLKDLLWQQITPERLYLETKWASLIPYQKTADLLKEVLPIDAKLNATTIQHHLHAFVEEFMLSLKNRKSNCPPKGPSLTAVASWSGKPCHAQTGRWWWASTGVTCVSGAKRPILK